MTARDLTEAERLELAGYIAPSLRRVTGEAARRRVKLVNAEGEVTGEATLGEALKGLAKIHELEHAVAEGQKPKTFQCQGCGLFFQRPKGSRTCPVVCRAECGTNCETPGCGGTVGKYGRRAAWRQKRPRRCEPCATRASNAKRTPEQLSAAARKGHAKLTPEQRSAAGRKANAKLTPEQRSERQRKANAKRTQEQRSEAMRKAWATRRARETSDE